MMLAFRRWGHFYLALSNEALRKRTKEQNQARHQVRMEVDQLHPRLEQNLFVLLCAQTCASIEHCALCTYVQDGNKKTTLFLTDKHCSTHALSQRDTPEKGSLSIMERPRKERGRSRRSSSAGRRNGGRGQLQLSSSDVQVMVEQEAESVARELAGEPSLSLLALADARKEMDDIAMKAQVCWLSLHCYPSSDSQYSPHVEA